MPESDETETKSMAETNDKRIVVNIPEALHRKARLKSVRTGKSMSAFVREALEDWTKDEDEE